MVEDSSRASALILALGSVLCACAPADAGGGDAADRSGGSRSAGSGTASDPFGNAGAAGACLVGVPRACDCPDGTPTGTQACLASGELGPCQGCRTQRAASEAASGEPVRDGALCPMLSGQSGCTDQSFRSDELPASVLFLVDRSGSMRCNLPEAGQSSEECEAKAETKLPDQPTKWQVTISALERVMAELVDSGASAGLSFFTTDDFCGVDSAPAVPVAPVDAAHAALLDAALTRTTPNGGTPIVGGTILAYQHLHAEAGLDASKGCAQPPCGAHGNRFVVLITDGADSCPTPPFEGACGGGACTDFLLDTSVLDALRVNIRTFVIGAPGSEPARGFLSELAKRGGTAKNGGNCTADRTSASGDCHFDMTTSTDFAADLGAALDAISGSALGCEFPVPQPEGQAPTENVNVQYRAGGTAEPVCIGFDQRPCDGGADGFQFARHPDGTPDLTKVVLCGAACERVKSDPAIQIDVVLGCSPLVVD